MANRQVVLITGASSGIGKATAGILAKAGYCVFGTSRNPSSNEGNGFGMLELDVCSDDSVKTCFEQLMNKAGRLDILINNAGAGFRGAIEESGLEETWSVFEVNFFGLLRTTKLALPIMRRQGGGLIINISSIVGRVAAPYSGIYSASKFAVEGYTEALRYEVAQFGIKVSLVEPGVIVTNFNAAAPYSREEIPAYNRLRRQTKERIGGAYGTSPGPEIVARAIYRIIRSKKPRLRYLVGRDAKVAARGKRWLPFFWFEKAARRVFKI